MLANAMSSSRSGALLHHSVSRCERTSASSPSIRQYDASSPASTPSGTVVSTPARGSSNDVPNAQWPWSSPASSPSYTEPCSCAGLASCVWFICSPVVEPSSVVELVETYMCGTSSGMS